MLNSQSNDRVLALQSKGLGFNPHYWNKKLGKHLDQHSLMIILLHLKTTKISNLQILLYCVETEITELETYMITVK